MQLSEKDLFEAVSLNIITHEQRLQLVATFAKSSEVRPKFDLANVLFYFGALIVISAMTWFMTAGWGLFGPLGGMVIAASYAVLYMIGGGIVWYGLKMKTPGGLLFTIAVCMVPLMIYCLLEMAGQNPQSLSQWDRFWRSGHSGYLIMEFSTILTGLLMLYFIRFPFLTAPIAVALYFMSFDIVPFITNNPNYYYWNSDWQYISLAFGAVILLASYLVDRRTKEDFAFWGYLFGMLAFWCGLTLLDGNSQIAKALYCAFNLGLIALSLILQRKVFMVFGAFGVVLYLGYLSYDVFRDSIFFPIILSMFGVLVIALGVLYQLKKEAIQNSITDLIPETLQKHLPQNRQIMP